MININLAKPYFSGRFDEVDCYELLAWLWLCNYINLELSFNSFRLLFKISK
jgi:hypothetical protein